MNAPTPITKYKQHPFARVPQFWVTELRGSSQMFAVAIVLSLHDGDNGCYPSIETISAETELRKDVVKRTLDALESRSIFTRYIEAGRTYYVLSRDPKSHESCEQLHESCDFYHESCTPIRKENRHITDHRTEVPPGLIYQEDTMGKIISEPRRVTPTEADKPIRPARSKKADARYQEITNLVDMFARNFGISVPDNAPWVRKQWAALIDEAGSANEAWKIAEEAHNCKAELYSEKYPLFNAQAVLYYFRFIRPGKLAKKNAVSDNEAGIRIRAIQRHGKSKDSGVYTLEQLCYAVRSLRGVSREHLLAAGVDAELADAVLEQTARKEIA